MKKISSLFFIFILIFQSFASPVYALSSAAKEDDEEKTILINSDEEGMPMYEEPSDSSNLLITLHNNDQVDILEEFDEFTLVSFLQEESNMFLQGFIQNNVLIPDSSEYGKKDKNTESEVLNESIEANEDVEMKEDSPKGNDSNNNSEVSQEVKDDSGNSTEDSDSYINEKNPETKEETDDSTEDNTDKENTTNTFSSHVEVVTAIGLRNPTNVRATNSTKSDIIHTFNQGSILSIETYSKNWYRIEVENNGVKQTGFVHQKHIEIIQNNQKILSAIGVRGPTNVRELASTKSKVAKPLPIGTIIDLRSFSTHWYEVLENNKVIGYVHQKHIDNSIVSKQKKVKAIGARNTTNIRALPSTKAKIATKISKGEVIELTTFSKDWYEVISKGKKGYMHKKHIEIIQDNQTKLSAIGLRGPTNVREFASTKSKIAKPLPIGTIINLRSFSTHWYEALENNKVIGYVHQKHIDNSVISKQKKVKAIGAKNTTNIRALPSTKAKVATKISKGDIIELKTFSRSWYEVTSKGKKGYVHQKHIHIDNNIVSKQEALKGIGIKSPTNIRTLPSTKVSVAEKRPIGDIINLKTFSKNWYEATTTKGKKGYVHKKHIGDIVDSKQVRLEGIGIKKPTNIRALPSTKAKVLEKRPKRDTIQLRTFSQNWYEATTKSGKKGYVHKKHVNEKISISKTKYNISLKEILNIQMKATPQTDKKVAWVSKNYIKKNKVTANKLNVRTGPGTNTDSLGTISKGTTVKVLDEHNGWYMISHNHKKQWVHAGPKDVLYYLNPDNFAKNDREMFQFLDLSKPSGVNQSTFNQYLKGRGSLSGQGKAFIDAGKKHKINDVYLISHAILETGHGTSRLANGIEVGKDKKGKTTMVTSNNRNKLTKKKIVYNMFGIRAFDTCAIKCGAEHAYDMGWTSVDKAIIGGAKFIDTYITRGQNTLYKMRWDPEYMAANGRFGLQYATDIGWASKQINTMYNMYAELDSYVLQLDIPTYNK